MAEDLFPQFHLIKSHLRLALFLELITTQNYSFLPEWMQTTTLFGKIINAKSVESLFLIHC